MKKILVFLLVLIAGNAFAKNTLVAIVNNNPITLNSIKNKLVNVDSVHEKIKILESQIYISLQIQKTEELNLKPSEENVFEVLKDIAKKNNISVDELLNFENINSIKEEISEKLAILNLQRFVTKDLKKPTKKILSECSGPSFEQDQKQIKIAQIIISEIDSDSNDPEHKNVLIKSFLNKLSEHISKGASFEAFAKLHSQHPSYKDGGITEWLTINNPTLEMLDSLEKNEVSDIYPTVFGLAIAIKIDERFISSKLKECEEQLIYQNAEKYYASWLQNLRDEAYIEIYYDKL